MTTAGTGMTPVYRKPGLEQLGSFATLTLGSKWHSMGDLMSGQNVASGPGS